MNIVRIEEDASLFQVSKRQVVLHFQTFLEIKILLMPKVFQTIKVWIQDPQREVANVAAVV